MQAALSDLASRCRVNGQEVRRRGEIQTDKKRVRHDFERQVVITRHRRQHAHAAGMLPLECERPLTYSLFGTFPLQAFFHPYMPRMAHIPIPLIR